MSYQDDIQAAIYALQSTLGDFLKCGNTLLQIQDRDKPYLSSTTASVASGAAAIQSRVTGMLAQLGTLQAQSLADISAASAFKTSLDNDPSFAAIGGVSPDQSSLTAYMKLALSGKVTQALNLTKSLGSDALAANDFISKTNDVSSAMDDLDNLAAGKGLSGALASLTSPMGQLETFLGKEMNQVVIFLGLGLAVYLFLPGIVGGLCKQSRSRR